LFCFAEKKKTVFVAFEEKKSCCVLGEESLRKIDRRKICANRNLKKSLFLQERKKERKKERKISRSQLLFSYYLLPFH
jgi:hypothetical protein